MVKQGTSTGKQLYAIVIVSKTVSDRENPRKAKQVIQWKSNTLQKWEPNNKIHLNKDKMNFMYTKPKTRIQSNKYTILRHTI